MTKEQKITLAALVVSISASVIGGSLAFWLQQQVAVTEAKKSTSDNLMADAIRNWQEAQHRIDLAVLHEDIARFGNPSAVAFSQINHTVDQEIERAWFYKQLAIASDTNFIDAQRKLFSAAEEDARRQNNVGPIVQYFDTLFAAFKQRMDSLETQQADLQKAASQLRFLQLLVTQSAVVLQVVALILAFYKLQCEAEKQRIRHVARR